MSGITVLKFGSSVLHDEGDLPRAVHEVYRHLRRGRKVIAVVSALGKTTDGLIARAKAWADRPDPAALAALLATGEATTVALLTLALERSGIPATPFDAARAGLTTKGDLLDADPVSLDVAAVRRALEAKPVLVVPGFLGRDASGATSLLGRGGSDLTALFLARTLGADECRLLKDVDGVYDGDPNAPALATGAQVARRYAELSWDAAEKIGGRIVQPKSLRFARESHLCFEVTAAAADVATVVGPGPTSYSQPVCAAGVVRVGLLGLGTVGLGVYRHLASQSDKFEVVRVAVRDIRKHAEEGVPLELLTNDPWEIVDSECDVVVEVMGGRRPAAALIVAALGAGKSVVTANKEILARHGARLERLGRKSGARLLFSAAVGGAVPVLETVRLAKEGGEIESVEGVLNGTTNFVLDGIADGLSTAEAVREAQRHGFAEADPTTDLDGSDAAHKLVLAAREAFGVEIRPEDVDRRGILELDAGAVRLARVSGSVVRLVASCRRTERGVEATVRPRVLAADHALAGVRREENRLIVTRKDGAVLTASGKGAGRWPTAEAVVADVLDLWRDGRRAAVEVEVKDTVAVAAA
jgi:homoserine dehydrogenase